MQSSRIFIKNLPPTLTVEDFRKHFSHQSTITDAKFIAHRRIGYVGYKTPEDAARAVKYHNRTFIRMSKIGVELARSVDEQRPLKSRTTGGHIADAPDPKTERGENAAATEKRKRAESAQNEDGKLREFLQVMQPPSKSKTWENQALSLSNQPDVHVEDQTVTASISDDEYEHVPKKQKLSLEAPHVLETPKILSLATTPAAEKEQQTIQEHDIEGQPQEAPQQQGEAPPTASDADWLRSRTSRLLGLVDDSDSLELPALGEEEQVKGGNHIQTTKSPDEIAVDMNTRTNQEEQPKDPPPNPPTVPEEHTVSIGRLFLRNLTYTITEEDLHHHFEGRGYGAIEEINLPIDSRTGNNKGYAHVQFTDHEAATRALQELDQKPLQGRLLHILPGNAKKQTGLDEFAISKLPLKKQQQIKRRTEAASSIFNWNSMYMNSDAVISSISDRLGVSKSDILDPTSSDAAVKQAHAETHVIQETKAYFASNSVDLDSFKTRARGETAILVKNFSYGTKPEELKSLFETHGTVTRFLMPPSGTIAIVEFNHADHAKSAFGDLAYRKFKDSILFLEKAPKDLFLSDGSKPAEIDIPKAQSGKLSTMELLEKTDTPESVNTSTLFVRNLNFSTTNERLREICKPLDGFKSARVKTKTDPKKPGQILSMGFGFLEFQSKQQAQTALAAIDGYKLDGHEILVRASHKAIDAAGERRNEDQAKKTGRNTKIIIKNLPFEASKKEVRSLFGAYGQLRSVRMPKKFDSSTRGFAFADFVTAREAENAMDALRNTHLLGRRLVLEFAAEETIDPEAEIEKMQQKVGKQADKVALQKLTGSGRKKFNVEGGDEFSQG